MNKYICTVEDYNCEYINEKLCIQIGECKYKKEINGIGYEAGDVCNRDNCLGIIQEEEKRSCTCFLGHPPCSACTEPRAYCDECGWSDRDEQAEIECKRREEREVAKKFYDSVPKRIAILLGYSREYL